MIVTFKTDELLPCLCGYIPDHYSVAYGRTPYSIFCPTCIKQNWRAVGGNPKNIISEWNNNVRLKTKEELKTQSNRSRKNNRRF